jgi:hypothetical protein
MDLGFTFLPLARQKPIESSPQDHSKRRDRRQNNCKNRDDRRVENESAQHSRQRGGKESGQCGAPELGRVMNDFILEKAQCRRQHKPRSGKREEDSSHTRQEGNTCLTMRGKTNDRDKGNGEQIAKYKD